DVRRTGARPLVAVFQNDADLASLRRGVGRGWQPLVDDLRRGGCPTVDLADGFERDGTGGPIADLFVRWHYSARGNRIVAAALGEAIGALGALGAAGGAAGEEERSAPEGSDREPHARAVGPSRVGRQAGTALDSIVWKGAFGVAMRR
ncbi:MAG: hypothetical protein ACKPBU_09350, partial [Alphaproteobacteria bacterium]